MNSRIYLLLLSLAIFACTEKKSTEITDTPEEPVMEWLTFEGRAEMPEIVLVSGDEEYRSEEALPMLARILSEQHGFNCTVLFAQDPANPGVVDPNYLHNIPGLDKLGDANLMIIFTRFRALPDDQMQHIENYVMAGKPLIGIRTATHAFNFQDSTSAYFNYGNYYNGDDAWNGGFGRLVLGENWVAHHGHHGEQSTRGVIADGMKDHPVMQGIDSGLWGPTDVYAVRLPMQESVTPLVLGKTVDRENPRDDDDPLLGLRASDSKEPGPATRRNSDGDEVVIDLNNPMMPIAWLKTYQLPDGVEGQVFASTIGASVDMLSEEVRRMYVNAVYHLLKMPVPSRADVTITGEYSPSRFAFHDDAHWDSLNIVIEEMK